MELSSFQLLLFRFLKQQRQPQLPLHGAWDVDGR
jgi:hypothetical protein